MRTASHSLAVAASLAVALGCFAPTTLADITGFNNLSGWTYTQSDGGTPADLPDADTIHLTSLGTGQARSLFYNTRQDITGFTASFIYRAANASVFGCEYGATFTLQGHGPAAVGSTGDGLGYAGISPSVAVTFQLRSNTTGYFTNGVLGGGSAAVGPIDLVSGHDIAVTLGYNGSILAQTMRDTVTGAEFTRNIIVGDLSAVLGGGTAYVGFTASTTAGSCSGNAADQYFSDFRFTSVPAPGVGVLLAGSLLASARRRR